MSVLGVLPSNSSRQASFNSLGTSTSAAALELLEPPLAASCSCTVFSHSSMISPLVLAHTLHRNPFDSAANIRRTSSVVSRPPSWPLGSVSMNDRNATKAVRTPHAGCHVSSWCPLIDRQISRFVSNLPEGVTKRKDGGLRGYMGGRTMRPW